MKQQFYHGTKAGLAAGNLLTPGGTSNYTPGITMNHIYFTALLNGDWQRPPTEELQKFRDKLANNKGDIIN